MPVLILSGWFRNRLVALRFAARRAPTFVLTELAWVFLPFWVTRLLPGRFCVRGEPRNRWARHRALLIPCFPGMKGVAPGAGQSAARQIRPRTSMRKGAVARAAQALRRVGSGGGGRPASQPCMIIGDLDQRLDVVLRGSPGWCVCHPDRQRDDRARSSAGSCCQGGRSHGERHPCAGSVERIGRRRFVKLRGLEEGGCLRKEAVFGVAGFQPALPPADTPEGTFPSLSSSYSMSFRQSISAL